MVFNSITSTVDNAIARQLQVVIIYIILFYVREERHDSFPLPDGRLPLRRPTPFLHPKPCEMRERVFDKAGDWFGMSAWREHQVEI